MKPLVIAATALALVAPAYAQTAPTETAPAETMPATDPAAPAQAAEQAADTAETAAESAESAADAAADESGAAATQAADEAATAADTAADAAATAADDAATATQTMPEADAAENAADAADDAEAAASDAADSAADAAEEAPVTPPDVNAPMISEADPGLLSSWLTSRRIWTTNEPSSTEWDQAETLEERPAEWQDIAKVNDIVLDESGTVVGYIADIGGFLGIGAKKVLLGVDAIHMTTVGNDTFFATNYTKEELQALPDFDEKTVRK